VNKEEAMDKENAIEVAADGAEPQGAFVRLELMAGDEAEAVAEAVRLKTPHVVVERPPGMVQISARGWLELACADVASEFGEAWSPRRLEVIMANYAGFITHMDENRIELRWAGGGKGEEEHK
jgi:hypothetical protein